MTVALPSIAHTLLSPPFLSQLVEGTLSMDKVVTSHRALVRKEFFFRLAELANSALAPEERTTYSWLCDWFMETVQVRGQRHTFARVGLGVTWWSNLVCLFAALIVSVWWLCVGVGVAEDGWGAARRADGGDPEGTQLGVEPSAQRAAEQGHRERQGVRAGPCCAVLSPRDVFVVRLAVLTTFVASFLLVVFYTCVGCGQVLQQWIQSTVGNTTDASAAATADGGPRTFSIGGRSILPALGNGTAFPTDLLNASNIVRFPAGVPINLLPLLLRASRTAELTRDDVALLKVGARLSTALSRPLSTALSNPYLTRDDVALLKVTTCLRAGLQWGVHNGPFLLPCPVPFDPSSLPSPALSHTMALRQEKVFTDDILGKPVVDYSALLVTFRGDPATSAADTLRQVPLVPI